jgi:hypothetical protein
LRGEQDRGVRSDPPRPGAGRPRGAMSLCNCALLECRAVLR